MFAKLLNLKQSIFVVSLVVMLVLANVQPALAAWYPNNITALGDSITRAYNTGSTGFSDAPANSWTTGTNTSVNSLYSRILAVNPLISAKNTNLAVSGAKMVDLNGQAAKIATTTEYVTILMGANDVCTSSVTNMTAVATFQAQFEAAMATITSRAPNAKVYVVSIPNVYNLWTVFKNNSTARATWSLFKICQSLLANPTSTKQADVNRRAAVQQRNREFNTVLATVCARYTQCHFDNNAVFNTVFTTADVSTRDYFHPSLSGQTKLAGAAWAAGGLPYP